MNNERLCANSECCEKLIRRSQIAYCTSACATESKFAIRIESWINGEWDGSSPRGEISSSVRKFLLDEAKYKCSECGWDKINPSTGNCPVEIDHIDGNSENNTRTNLRVMCPNCHSLTPTYKGLNVKGRGTRVYRKKYDQFAIVGRKEKDLSKQTCTCGNPKERTAKQCWNCFVQEVKPGRWGNPKKSCECEVECIDKACNKDKSSLFSSYPPKEEMVIEINKIGLTKYSLTLGKTANTVKKHLKKQGYTNDDLRIVREVKVVHCSHKDCGVELTLDEVKMDRKRCADHTVISIVYPSNEEIISGVRELGYNSYARTLGLSYGSSVRKYLKRQGIDLNSSLQ